MILTLSPGSYLKLHVSPFVSGSLYSISLTLVIDSVTQSCLTPCDPMDCSTPGFPVHHQLPELAQTHVRILTYTPMVKNLPANARDIRDMGSIPGSGRSPGGRHGNPLQCSCLENPMDRGAWWDAVHRVTKSWTGLKRLSSSSSPVILPTLDCLR